jgi:hypothetical protein
MDSVGVDVARGGKDETVIARRHGCWFDEPMAIPGGRRPTARMVATHTMLNRRDGAPIHIDVIGVGSSPFDILHGQIKAQTVAVDVRNKTPGVDKTGHMRFTNLRSELWWRMREWLDPENNTGAMLPPNSRLKADLTAPKWRPIGNAIQVESKEEIEARIGRSPDYGTAYMLALIDTPKEHSFRGALTGRRPAYDPYASLKG